MGDAAEVIDKSDMDIHYEGEDAEEPEVIDIDSVKFQYNLNDFDERDIEKAKEFVAEGLKGLMENIAYEKAHQMIEQLRNIPFGGDDPLQISIEFETIGNDILLAMGVAKRQRKGNKNGKES